MKGVVFDLGNVLVAFDHLRSARRLSDLTGISPVALHETLSYLYSRLGFDDGRVSPSEFHAAVCETIGTRKIGFSAFYDIWNDIFSPLGDMLGLISKLKGNCLIGLLSNTNPPHFGYCFEKYRLLRLIDRKTLSFEVGCSKPDSKIYARMIASMEMDPKNILFIDDMPENVEAAKKCGLVSIVHSQFRETAEAIALHLDADPQALLSVSEKDPAEK